MTTQDVTDEQANNALRKANEKLITITKVIKIEAIPML
jgi:hypothetical protein